MLTQNMQGWKNSCGELCKPW